MTAMPKGRKAPAFYAVCKQGRWVPLAEVLSWPREEQPDTTSSRWDKKLGCEVAAVQCDFTTEDPKAFEQHMAEAHGRKSTKRGIWSTPSSQLPYTVTPRWRPPSRKELVPSEWVDRVDELGQPVTLEILDDEPVLEVAS